MPSIEYSRSDFEIAFAPDPEAGGVTIGWTSPDGAVTERELVAADVVDRWMSGTDPLTDLSSLAAALLQWEVRVSMRRAKYRMDRVALDIAYPDLARITWEYFIGRRIPMAATAVVRTTRTLSRARNVPLTLPVRMVEIRHSAHSPLKAAIMSVFGKHSSKTVDQALQVASVIPGAFPPSGWPAVDILHCDRLETVAEPSTLLTPFEPETFGTLGWFLRASEKYQTKLIVLHCDTPEEASWARALGTALARRGGPAVLVGDFPATMNARREYREFYWNLVHDYPLDFALFRPRGQPPLVDLRSPTLIGGAGREDALRVSAIGAALVDLTQFRPDTGHPELSAYVRDLLKTKKRRKSDVIQIRSDLSTFASNWNTLKFDLHEREGFLPVATTLHAMRGNAGVGAPVAWTAVQRLQVPGIPRRSVGRFIRVPKPYERVVRSGARRTRPHARAPVEAEARFLNASLWREDEPGQVERLAATDSLERGRVYHVGAQVGPRDSLLVTIGATAILEEVFKFAPESTGVWVEIGVTGLDFELLGDPVQELWLPRDAPSDMVYFPVRTDKTRWARLRLCLYFKNFVVQSLRLGAVVVEPTDPVPSSQARGERLGAALGTSGLGSATAAGHAARLEYNLAVPVSDLEQRADRALTIVANDNDGQAVVTVKGEKLPFETYTNNNLPMYVSAMRDALHAVSFPPIPNVTPDLYQYPFWFGGQRNVGAVEDLKKALQTLATRGWQLFDATFPKSSRGALAATLSREDRIIHVAHVLLEKTIPWAAMYDRTFDPGKGKDEQGRSVLHDACLAALNPDGTFRANECRTHAECLLHPANIATARADPQARVPHVHTIACPLHFWGFRHIIELPAQQVPENANDARPLVPQIRAGQSAQMVAGLNLDLPLAKDHGTELDGIPKIKGVSAVWKVKATARDDVLTSLLDQDLHAIYFYCHTGGGKDLGVIPYLEFQDMGVMGRITSDLLNPDDTPNWKNAPLVLLNGCGTAGFSPDALSPFVLALVSGRGASGVVATEITVAEPLAAEAAMTFLGSFLEGTPAGAAMLGMRRKLLAKNNPLGLVYTLYSAADLKLVYDK